MQPTGRLESNMAQGNGLLFFSRAIFLLLVWSKLCLAEPSLLTPASGACVVGNELPSFAILDNSGKVISSRQMINAGMPLLIGLWAPWCLPCIESMDAVNAWDESRKAAGLNRLNMLFITVGSTGSKVDSLRLTKKWTFPVAHDRYNQIAKKLGFNNQLPYSILTDKDGVVSKIFLTEGDDWIEMLDKFLSDKP